MLRKPLLVRFLFYDGIVQCLFNLLYYIIVRHSVIVTIGNKEKTQNISAPAPMLIFWEHD